MTEVLLPQLKTKLAGPLFLFKKTPAAPPLLPCDSPERTSVGAADLCPHPTPLHPIYSSLSLLLKLNLLLLLHCGSTWSAKVLLPRWCSNVTTSSVEGSLDLFSRPPAQGPDERLLPGEAAEWKQKGEILYKIHSFKDFFFQCPNPLPLQNICATFSINTLKNPTCLLHLFLFPESHIL